MGRLTTAARAIAAIVLAAVAALPASAEWLLRLQLDPGSTQRFAMTHSWSTKLLLDGTEQEMDNASRIEMRQVVRQKLDDGTLVLETTYERMRTEMDLGGMKLAFDSAKPDDSGNPLARMQRELIGKPFVVTMTALGEVREVEGVDALFDGMAAALADDGADASLDLTRQAFGDEAVKALFQQCGLAFPDRAVGPGDTWRKQMALPNPALGELRVTSEYRVVGRETFRERDCVKVSVASTIEFAKQGPAIDQLGSLFGTSVDVEVSNATGEGVVWVEAATGLVVDSQASLALVMDMSFDVPTEGGAPPRKVSMHGTVAQRIGIELVD